MLGLFLLQTHNVEISSRCLSMFHVMTKYIHLCIVALLYFILTIIKRFTHFCCCCFPDNAYYMQVYKQVVLVSAAGLSTLALLLQWCRKGKVYNTHTRLILVSTVFSALSGNRLIMVT